MLGKKRIILLFVFHCFSFVVLQLDHIVFVFIVALLSPVFVIVCYWFCHLPGVVLLFLLMFSSFPPMGCQRKFCPGHLCKEKQFDGWFLMTGAVFL